MRRLVILKQCLSPCVSSGYYAQKLTCRGAQAAVKAGPQPDQLCIHVSHCCAHTFAVCIHAKLMPLHPVHCCECTAATQLAKSPTISLCNSYANGCIQLLMSEARGPMQGSCSPSKAIRLFCSGWSTAEAAGCSDVPAASDLAPSKPCSDPISLTADSDSMLTSAPRAVGDSPCAASGLLSTALCAAGKGPCCRYWVRWWGVRVGGRS